MDEKKLVTTASSLVAPGKGILAADESFGTIKKRFDPIHLESTEEHRRAYRDLLISAPDVEKHISGVILFDETIHQKTAGGTPFPQVLSSRGILPGIKVDEGTVPLAGFPGEKITEGLDGLRDRLKEYRSLGAAFAKWRAVITIGDGIPTPACIADNAQALARYAALCQEQDLVPIVEPEVLMEGPHTLERCAEVTEAVLRRVFDELEAERVLLEGMLLKPNMVISGTEAPVQAGPEEVARATLQTLRRTVPAAVPGIVFLSGGQSPEEATRNLNVMNQMDPNPWQLSFSYGRALQDPVIRTWNGNPANVKAAQQVFYHRAELNSLARTGKYTPEMEGQPA